MSGKRILFIDGDEAFIRDIAGGVEQQGYQAIVTGSSVEGVELTRTEHPDLVVVSVELTPAAGWSVCTRLKKDEELKDIPLILTSSTSTQDTFEKHKKLKTRADEYLLKPYSVDELLRLAAPLLGVAEPVGEEDLIAEDESLGTEFPAGSEEEIHVASDEPLANGHDAPLDPLEGSGDLVIDDASLGELASEELEAAPAEGVPAASGDDMEAFEQSFDALSGIDESAPAAEEAAPAEEAAADPLADVGEAAEFGELGEGLNLETAAEGEAAVGEIPVSSDESFSAEPAVPPEPPADADMPWVEETTSATPIMAEEEAPVSFESEPAFEGEVPVEAEQAPPAEAEPIPVEEAPALEPEPVAAAPASEPAPEPAPLAAEDLSRIAELETKIASLEAELEGFRATEGSHSAEMERLRVESARKDEEAEKLQDQIRERDRLVRELRDADSRASVEAARSRDDRVRKDAQIKALTQKTEQLTAASQKAERELAASREEVTTLSPLKAKVADLEQQLKIAQAAAAEAKGLRDEIEKGRRDLDRVRAAHGQAVIDLETNRKDLEVARVDLEETRRVAAEQTAAVQELQKKLAEVEQQMQSFAAQAQAHGDRAGKARAQLLALAEELNLPN